MRRITHRFAILGILSAAPWVAQAGTTVYKCVNDGQTILSDRPCDSTPVNQSSDGPSSSQSPTPSTSTTVPSSSSPSPVGRWAGQVQYHATENGQTVQEAHSVVLLSAEFTLDGKVSGTSADNGCTLLGIWSQDQQHIAWLDVTLSACRYPNLDRRFTGSFLLGKPDSSGQIQLITPEPPHAGQGTRIYDIKGTLRR